MSSVTQEDEHQNVHTPSQVKVDNRQTSPAGSKYSIIIKSDAQSVFLMVPIKLVPKHLFSI